MPPHLNASGWSRPIERMNRPSVMCHTAHKTICAPVYAYVLQTVVFVQAKFNGYGIHILQRLVTRWFKGWPTT